MPYSYTTYDSYVRQLIQIEQPKMVLDIGPGAGKYGVMARAEMPQSKLYAVEIDPSYVDRFGLRSIYNEILVGDALELIKQPQLRFDLVIMGDCIEHMRKSAAIDLLNFLVYRTGYICIVTPEAFQQDDWEGHASEAHISTWSEHDFQGWKTIHKFYDNMHLFLVRGFQPVRIEVTS